MLATEREKLYNRQGEYLSIGITESGAPLAAVRIPWEKMHHAFNMKTPDVYLTPEDLSDPEILAQLDRFQVIGCYIRMPLEDYSFLSRFPLIRDLNIYYGGSIRSLSFLAPLKECSMLYLEDANLPDLDLLLDAKKENPSILGPFRCVCLHNCHVEDLTRFSGEPHRFFEFLVWCHNSDTERPRWQSIKADTLRIYEIE